ncbi:hypothetical protein SASPL_143300 [Salvia splendens]|uniref:Uncharacterized protein n=1 Tax=Salvia splendens TaxID=180675 RepID=A0A8X8Z9W1_SALSN|nr:hypothetical protein SASPL_143300 [Salvia splendens]
MAANAVTGSCNTTFLSSSLPKPPPSSHKLFPISRQFLRSYRITAPQHLTLISTASITRLSVSSPETSAVEAEQTDDGVSSTSASLSPYLNIFSFIYDVTKGVSLASMGCNACGREEIERGCNGEGRIQGGIATVPGFGWWPIKAYRPCPAYLQSGGRYRRTGQSMDEVVSGGGGGRAKPTSSASVFTSSDKIFSKSLGLITSFTFQTPFPGLGGTSTVFLLAPASILTDPSSASETAFREQFPMMVVISCSSFYDCVYCESEGIWGYL